MGSKHAEYRLPRDLAVDPMTICFPGASGVVWNEQSPLLKQLQLRLAFMMSWSNHCLEHVPTQLVGGIPTPRKYLLVNWDDDIPNIWENKKCSKAPTRQCCLAAESYDQIHYRIGINFPRDKGKRAGSDGHQNDDTWKSGFPLSPIGKP